MVIELIKHSNPGSKRTAAAPLANRVRFTRNGAIIGLYIISGNFHLQAVRLSLSNEHIFGPPQFTAKAHVKLD